MRRTVDICDIAVRGGITAHGVVLLAEAMALLMLLSVRLTVGH